MLRILVLVVATLVAVSVATITPAPDCFRENFPLFKCCKTLPNKPGILFQKENTECRKLTKDPPSCESDLCIAKLHGFADAEGKFDKVKIIEQVQAGFGEDPELAEKMIQNCAQADLSGYGPSEICDSTKLRHCFIGYLAAACKNWDNTTECQTTKDLLLKCFS